MAPANPSSAPTTPTTPSSGLEDFGNPHSPFFNPDRNWGQATSFRDDLSLDYVADSKGEEEDVPPPLENVDPILIAVGCGIFCFEPGEIDFIPFEVHGPQCCCMKGFLNLCITPTSNPSSKNNFVVNWEVGV